MDFALSQSPTSRKTFKDSNVGFWFVVRFAYWVDVAINPFLRGNKMTRYDKEMHKQFRQMDLSELLDYESTLSFSTQGKGACVENVMLSHEVRIFYTHLNNRLANDPC